jgi:glucose-6-phosphate-specific signal transduction histidine kinase
VIFGAGIFLAVSIFIPREFRHRDMIMPIALMLAAEGLVFSRKWWYLGLLFWIPLVGFIAWKLQSLVPLLLAAALALITAAVWRVYRARGKKETFLRKET